MVLPGRVDWWVCRSEGAGVRRQGLAVLRPTTLTRVLAVTGKPGSGKTTICRRLAPLLGWDVLSIDQERRDGGDWDTLTEKVKALNAPAIIESVAKPDPYLEALGEYRVSELVITCDEAERRRRVQHRPIAGQWTSPPYDRHKILNTTDQVSDTRLQELARWAAW